MRDWGEGQIVYYKLSSVKVHKKANVCCWNIYLLKTRAMIQTLEFNIYFS